MIVRTAFTKSFNYKNLTCRSLATANSQRFLCRAQTRHCSSLVQFRDHTTCLDSLTRLTASSQHSILQTLARAPHILSIANASCKRAAPFSTAVSLRSKNNPRKWPSDKVGSGPHGGLDQGVTSRPAQSPETVHSGENLRKQESESQTASQQSQTAPKSPEPSDRPANTSTDSGPKQPLPDLTQGIPPTFEREYGSHHASAKRHESETTDLDLTEESTRDKGEEDHSREEYVSSIEQRRNAIAKYMYITAFAMIAAGAIPLGQNWDNAEEEKRHPEAPNGWHPWAFYSRIKARIAEMMGYYTEPTFPQLLPTLDSQFGMPAYTLVLSLEDLLVHSGWSRQSGWNVAKRPGVDYFIRYLSQYYELVIFTTLPSMNAEMVIKKLDPYQIVMFPLFREATRYMKGEHVKVCRFELGSAQRRYDHAQISRVLY